MELIRIAAFNSVKKAGTDKRRYEFACLADRPPGRTRDLFIKNKAQIAVIIGIIETPPPQRLKVSDELIFVRLEQS